MDYKWLSYFLFAIVSFVVLEKFTQYIIKTLRSTQNTNVFCEQFVEESEGGTYFYRKTFENRNLSVVVVPRIGDPDLYISYSNQPTFQLENHDQNSCTCGVEELKSISDIRPIYIGVYCYNTNVNCSFELYICSTDRSVTIVTSTPNKHFIKNLKSSSLKSTFLSLIENFFVEILSALY